MTAQLAVRLDERRRDMGLGAEFMSAVGLGDDEWADVLSGRRVLTATQFERACQVLVVEPAAFYRAEPDDASLAPARFRGLNDGTVTAPEDKRRFAVAAQVGRELGRLARVLERTPRIWLHQRSVPVQSRKAPWQQGYDLADRFSRAVSRGVSPVQDLGAWFRELGVHVVPLVLATPEVKGVTITGPGCIPVVLVNLGHKGMSNRGVLRSTLAHELAHVLFDVGETGYTTEVSTSNVRRTERLELVEKRANAFGPALLAPTNGLRTYVGQCGLQLNDTGLWRQVAEHWGFSYEGAVSHGKNVFGLSEDEYIALVSQQPRPSVRLLGFESTLAGMFSQRTEPDQLGDSVFWTGLAQNLLDHAVEADIVSESVRAELTGAR